MHFLQDWVIDLPDTISLLDINTGIRYPKEQVFNHRAPVRAPPAPRDYPDLNFGPPLGSAQGAQSMMQAMQSQGTTLQLSLEVKHKHTWVYHGFGQMADSPLRGKTLAPSTAIRNGLR